MSDGSEVMATIDILRDIVSLSGLKEANYEEILFSMISLFSIIDKGVWKFYKATDTDIITQALRSTI